MNYFKKGSVWMATLLLLLLVVGFTQTGTNYFEVSKNLDIFASVYREVNTYYVDEVDAGKLMKKGIDEMLKSLDPYTNFISESEIEDFRFTMTGQYGGIGSQITTRNDYIMITDPYEGFPAQKADLRAGDIILEVEGKSAKGKSSSDMSKLLKGQPGTKVTLKIKRDGEGELIKTLTREEIQVKNVPYSGMVTDQIGYIRLQSFTNNAGKEVNDALVALKKNPNLRSVILDVRGNPGGLLQEAVNIVNVFVPRGIEVVSTRGKIKDADKVYKTLNNPVDTAIPLIVLTNRSSASASEIVSGGLQDLDRAVVIGTRTFGKGLVQNTRPLNYGTQIKITTAKYYTPSGRCIQALDYSHRNEDGSVGSVPDSLKKEFKTKGGRSVYDGGGVEPDVLVKQRPLATITESLLNKQLLFDYATYYRAKYPQIASANMFQLTESDFQDFKNFIANKDYDYQTNTEKELESFRKKAEEEKYWDAIKDQYEALKKNLAHDKQADLDKNKDEIIELLTEEIARRYYYQRARYETGLKADDDVKEAVSLLSNSSKYQAILAPRAKK
ncbi:MAG: S41 family peptidase [Bacteroidia bacterium]|nr:S41 family peptidase [Bacteroidia bacterium]